MAKDRERQLAQSLYIDQCLTAKEISERLNVSEKTIGKWVDAGNWKDLKLAKQTTPNLLLAKYHELMGSLLDKRLLFEKMAKPTDEDKEEHRNIIDSMSKISVMIDRLQGEKISLRIHVHCLEKFMAALNQHDHKLFMQLIDFQIEYLTMLSEELK